jgi:phage-related protein
MADGRKPLAWLHGGIIKPPFSVAAARQAGYLLGLVQEGESLGMPKSRPMPSVGPNCHELRVSDKRGEWRIIYCPDPDAVLILDIFAKDTEKTPRHVIDACAARLKAYRRDSPH